MANFDFSRLRDIERIAGDRMDKVVRGTLLDLSRRIVLRTPVGNPDLWITNVAGPDEPADYRDYISERGFPEGYAGGSARGNWQTSLGAPASGEVDSTDKAGVKTLAKMWGDTKLAPGNVWYLTNNLPYVSTALEYGSSTQAPTGMVRISLREIDQSIDDQISRLT